ncbi:MAG TPA: CYCXC family (seleno)protein [Pyrinomonadaceae bacterium]|nr:CYCXC family (seleno)protein [Pyrinomonadaceae bacterium]
MKNRLLFGLIAVLALGAGLLLLVYSPSKSQRVADSRATTASHDEASHASPRQKPPVPAFMDASQVGDLPPTLPAANFFGKAREAYAAAKEIPGTLAQLPCYCYCDQTFGHKSLHTCFVDDHASQCAVCVDEALLAYRLQKEEKKTPEQVRQIIIEKYASEN